MRSKCLLFALSAVAVDLVTSVAFAQSQAGLPNSDDARFPVVISYGDGKTINTSTDHDIAPKIGLHPAQLISVTLELPSSRSGESVAVTSIDGSRMVTPTSGISVQSDGTIRFDFQARQAPGLYRVLVQLGSDEYQFQFYVLDQTPTANNPRMAVAE